MAVSVCRQSLQTEQSERNEDIFGKKRASPYISRAVELFVKALENTIKNNIPYEKKQSFIIIVKFCCSYIIFFQGRK